MKVGAWNSLRDSHVSGRAYTLRHHLSVAFPGESVVSGCAVAGTQKRYSWDAGVRQQPNLLHHSAGLYSYFSCKYFIRFGIIR